MTCKSCNQEVPKEELTTDGFCYPCSDPTEPVDISAKLVEAVNDGLLKAHVIRGRAKRGEN